MGWLKQAREEMEFTSDRKLAEHLLAQPGRPGELTLPNLANQLGKLDKGDAAWWLATGEPWIPLLAEALGFDVDELRGHIHRQVHPTDAAEGGEERLIQLGWLRALDLAVEALPPGLPWPLDPLWGGEQRRVWWTAGPGSGKTLLGRWLALNQRWNLRRAATWREALGDLPATGRVYVELQQPGDEPCRPEDAPAGLELWVAAPFGPGQPPDPKDEDGEDRESARPTWTEIRSPPLRDWVDALLAWVEPRVKPGGRYDGGEVVALLCTLPLEELFESPGDLLEFLALTDELGARALQEEETFDASRLMRRWLHTALRREDCARFAPLLRRDGDRILVELVRERLRRGLPQKLNLAEWASLVPDRIAPELDRNRLRALIEQGTPESLAEASALVKPGGEEVIGALISVRALTRDADGDWRLRPSWLAKLAQGAAVEALCEEGPEGLGALLLYPQSAAAGLDALLGQVSRGDLAVIRDCIQGANRHSPERLAALDGAFRVLGHRLLLGDDLPVELLAAVWREQMAHVAELYLRFPLLPIVMIGHEPHAALTHMGAWLRGALAIGLRLGDTAQAPEASPICPWGGMPKDPAIRQTYEQVLGHALSAAYADWREDPHGAELALACARLGVLALERIDGAARHHMVEQAAAITILVRLARDGGTLPSHGPVHAALSLPGGLTPLERTCAREGVALELVVGWLWRSWASHPQQHPPFQWTSRDQRDPALRAEAERLWRLLPGEEIDDGLIQHIAFRPMVWPWLPEGFWAMWASAQLRSPHAGHSHEKMWDQIPLPLLLDTLRTATLGAHQLPAYAAGWRRAPDTMLTLIDEDASQPERVFEGGTSVLRELLHTGVKVRPEALLDRAERWRGRPEAYPACGAWLDRWLMQAIESRVPGWRRAFDLLTEPT